MYACFLPASQEQIRGNGSGCTNWAICWDEVESVWRRYSLSWVKCSTYGRELQGGGRNFRVRVGGLFSLGAASGVFWGPFVRFLGG